MSALKLGVKGGIFVGALILLSACSSEDLTQNTYKIFLIFFFNINSFIQWLRDIFMRRQKNIY